jgi:hypothetical protein
MADSPPPCASVGAQVYIQCDDHTFPVGGPRVSGQLMSELDAERHMSIIVRTLFGVYCNPSFLSWPNITSFFLSNKNLILSVRNVLYSHCRAGRFMILGTLGHTCQTLGNLERSHSSGVWRKELGRNQRYCKSIGILHDYSLLSSYRVDRDRFLYLLW